jgi:hypothetical protein
MKTYKLCVLAHGVLTEWTFKTIESRREILRWARRCGYLVVM